MPISLGLSINVAAIVVNKTLERILKVINEIMTVFDMYFLAA
jgi:hypothetical protein